MQRTYHLGTVKGPTYGSRADTLYLEARLDIDYLSCETWEYLGPHITTKSKLRERKADILYWWNRRHNCQYKHLIVN